ncbi:MAG: HAMP domain-containing sensor histidine kinase [Spirochaetes bacterium]|nr:HAMP domain-containing sensor histidine kinase [Spirochaetota bacterium]
MANVGNTFRLVLFTLTAAEAAVAFVRLRHRSARREAAWLAFLLASFASRLAFPRGGPADFVIPAAVLASSGNLLLAIHDRPGSCAWSAVAGVFLALALVVAAVRPGGPDGAARLVAGAYGLLGLFPLGLAGLLWRKTGEPVDLLLFLSGVAWAASGAAELALGGDGRLADWLLAPLVLCIGFMLVEQGYLSPLTSPGYADRLAVHRRLSRETSEHLLDTERALEVQDRLVAAGVLALGASHEYRNVLASLRAAAAHALERADPAEKDRSLRLVLEHARSGGESATALLERLGREGREAPQHLRVRALLEHLGRTLRPVARHAGVRLVVECGEDLVIRARSGEIAQVLLNLARNALDGFARRGPGPAEPFVRLAARGEGRRAIVEVLDNAGGVPASQVPRLFQLGRSSRGSTGVGLYLARCLAERNGGSLAYHAADSGSCFVLELPRFRPAAVRQHPRGGPGSRPLA